MWFAFSTENNATTQVKVGHGSGAYGRECVCRIEVAEGTVTPRVAWLTRHEAIMLSRALLAFAEAAS